MHNYIIISANIKSSLIFTTLINDEQPQEQVVLWQKKLAFLNEWLLEQFLTTTIPETAI